jgi:hypothetical protein
MSEDPEKSGNKEFLSRWSRLKQQAREQPPAAPQAAVPAIDPKAPPPELPPLDKLTIDSDFRGFFHPKVDENLRRMALKRLFSDPHFNLMDGLDVYIDDYSKSDPLPAAMLAQLKHAQKIFAWAKETKEETGAKRAVVSEEKDAAPSPADQAPAITVEPPPVESLQDIEQHSEPQTTAGRKT